MPGNYGVTGAEVAAELPSLFPNGFSPTSLPTAAKVDEWIQVADDRVSLLVQRVSGALPIATDAAYRLGRNYVLSYVKGKVVRALYEGNAPERVQAAAVGYFVEATDALKELEALKDQASGTTDEGVTPKVRGEMPTPDREMIVTDEDLDPVRGRRRVF